MASTLALLHTSPTLNLYPTIEVAPSTPMTDAYLNLSRVRIDFGMLRSGKAA